ncbi:MAG: NUDIX domain-containing protein [Candidatus Dormibacteraeota bacterium]|nr:NUDIX domain-containing protein [Candidatus Dormibacteraeota bacterium]
MWWDRSEAGKRLLLRVWRVMPLPGRARSMLYWLLGTKYAVGVQGLVFDNEGRLLLLRHTYKAGYPWGLPGGGMQRGETTTQALQRELQEEAGLHVNPMRLLSVETHSNRLLIEVFYLCRAGGGAFRPNAEISDYGYFALDKLPAGTEPRLRRIIAAYAAAGLLPIASEGT